MKTKAWSLALLFLFLPLVTEAQSLTSERYEAERGNIQPADVPWWRVFNDPLLDSLITVASEQNFSVLSALQRIDMAKANLRIERASALPSITLNGGWSNQQSSGNMEHGVKDWNRNFSTTLDASWEIDIFGSIRQRVKAQRETFHASREEYAATQLSLAAEVASAYINLRETQQELSVVNRNCNTQAAVLGITETRYKTGLVSKLDVSQARSVYYSTRAGIPQLEAGINQYINQIAILLGLYPEDVRPVLNSAGPLPEYVEPVSTDIPVSLLLQRPDVLQAEREVDAKAALLGASKSDWLPKVFLNASAGYTSHSLKELMRKNSLTYELSPTISWTLFSGAKLINATRLAKAELEESVHQFNNTILTAVQETDNAISTYQSSLKQIVALREVCLQGEETLRLSLELYKQGLTPFQNVLDSLRSLLTYQNQLTQAQGYSLLQLISLYKATGGGWNN
ncbi:MAG: efflux transporter outer membrane subunit [Bacteroides sp.]|nr:efflux transporter outer membrane subunit [Bacteroides sp.]